MRTKGLENFKLPRWDDLPNLDLYLDQVLSLLDEWLSDYLTYDKTSIMTKTMINNYVKQKYIDAPVNKKYPKETVASLVIIAMLKPVYTISEISRLIKLGTRNEELDVVYDRFCDKIEEAVHHVFTQTAMPKIEDDADPRGIMWNVCTSFACQLYVRNIYLQAHNKPVKSE